MKSAIASFFLLFLLFFALVVQADDQCPDGNGIIRQDANLRSGPGTSFQVITPLLKGTRVLKKEQQGDWMRLKALKIKKTGWVHFTLVKDKPCTTLSPLPAARNSDAQKTGEHILSPKTIKQLAPKKGDSVPKRAAQLIGVIDIQQVINHSARGIAARQKFEELRLTVSAQEAAAAEEELISNVIVEIQAVVESYASQHGFSHIINKNAGSIFFHETSFDITADIIREYDGQVARHRATP